MTSMPASRRAWTTTFAPRSWPSSPGLATRIFIGAGGARPPRAVGGLFETGEAPSFSVGREGRQVAWVPGRVVGHAERGEADALAEGEARGVGVAHDGEDPVAVDLHDREHAR